MYTRDMRNARLVLYVASPLYSKTEMNYHAVLQNEPSVKITKRKFSNRLLCRVEGSRRTNKLYHK